MNHRRRAGIAATMGLAALLAVPAFGQQRTIDDRWYWNLVPDAAERLVRGVPSAEEAILNCLDCNGKTKSTKSTKQTANATRVTKRTVERAPKADLNKIYNHKDPIGNFCETKDGLYDQVKFFKPHLGPQQRTAGGYSLSYEGPDFFQDFTVTGDEVRSLGDRYMTDDGRIQYVLPLEYTEILSRNGREVTRETHPYKLVAYDCPGSVNVTFNQTINNCATCDDKTAETGKTETKTETRTETRRETKRDEGKDTTVLDEPTPFSDWSSRKEWTVGAGIGSDTTESAVIIKTPNKPDRIVPYEDIFSLTKTHFKFDYTTNNDLLSVHGAKTVGTSEPGDGYWAGCERYVDGTSVGALAEVGLFNTKVTPYVVGGVEFKRVETGTSAGRFGNVVDTNYDTLMPHAGVGVLFGKQNYNNFKVAGEYVWQDMNIQNYGVSPNSDDRGDGVTEGMVMITAAGQKFMAGDHVRAYFDAKYMQPTSQRATNPDEVIQSSEARNGRVGFDYYFTPNSNGSWKVGLEGQVAIEDATFPRGINMNRTSTAGMVNFGYTWGK